MEVAVIPLLFLVVPAGLALAAILGLPRLIERRRQKAYAAFCQTRGYDYQPARVGAEAQYAVVVALFNIGGTHKWRDEISGQFNGRPFTAFEYQYATGAGAYRNVYDAAMVHWRLDGPSLPHFTLVPANTYLFRIGRIPQEVDFPDDATFSKAYVLSGEDQGAIRALFTPELRAALAAAPGQHAAAQGQDLFWWRERRLPTPDEFDAFLTEGTRVAELFGGG